MKNFCYYIGYVRNGKISYITSLDGKCKGSPPNKGTWFKLDVSVRDGIAMIDLDGKHLVTTKPHFQSYSKGGDIFKYYLPFTNDPTNLNILCNAI